MRDITGELAQRCFLCEWSVEYSGLVSNSKPCRLQVIQAALGGFVLMQVCCMQALEVWALSCGKRWLCEVLMPAGCLASTVDRGHLLVCSLLPCRA
jgi:hypothetical protein